VPKHFEGDVGLRTHTLNSDVALQLTWDSDFMKELHHRLCSYDEARGLHLNGIKVEKSYK